MGLEDTDCDILLNLNFLPQVLESQTSGTGGHYREFLTSVLEINGNKGLMSYETQSIEACVKLECVSQCNWNFPLVWSWHYKNLVN